MKASSQIKVTLVILFLILACYLGAAFYQTRKNAVPKHVVTLAAFAKEMPTPVGMAIFQLANQTVILLQGPPNAFPAFPSGSPCYIFDRKGNLVDWSLNAADDKRFAKQWLRPRRSHHRKVSMQEALQFIKQ